MRTPHGNLGNGSPGLFDFVHLGRNPGKNTSHDTDFVWNSLMGHTFPWSSHSNLGVLRRSFQRSSNIYIFAHVDDHWRFFVFMYNCIPV